MTDLTTRALEREGADTLGLAYRSGLLPRRVVGLLRVEGDAGLLEDLGLAPVQLIRVRMHYALPDREQRLWACDCAERALSREREAWREPDERSWVAVRVARLYADEQATQEELAAAADAAEAAAEAAARAAPWAAWAATRDVTWAVAAAAAAAAGSSAWAAERAWQEDRLRYWAGVAARRLA